jgi:hypothetical protein
VPKLGERKFITVGGVEYQRVPPPKPRRYPKVEGLKCEFMTFDPALVTPLNEWHFEGSFILPPQQVPTKPGKRIMARFVLGYRMNVQPGKKGGFPLCSLKVMAFDVLAEVVLNEYRQGDHVVAAGKFVISGGGSVFFLNPVLTAIQTVKLKPRDRAVEAVDLADTAAVIDAATTASTRG